jgi:hypothetical protein
VPSAPGETNERCRRTESCRPCVPAENGDAVIDEVVVVVVVVVAAAAAVVEVNRHQASGRDAASQPTFQPAQVAPSPSSSSSAEAQTAAAVVAAAAAAVAAATAAAALQCSHRRQSRCNDFLEKDCDRGRSTNHTHPYNHT